MKSCITAMVSCLLIAACGPKPAAAKQSQPKPTKPASLQKLRGEAELVRITLTPEAETRLGIRTAPVARKSVPRVRTLGGEVVIPPGQSIAVTAPLAGLLSESRANAAGQPVAKGETVFTLAPLVAPGSQVDLARMRAIATGDVEKAKADLDAAKIAQDRAVKLLADGAGSVKDADSATAAWKLAQVTLTASQATQKALLEAMPDPSTGSAAPIAIPSPIAGVLRAIHARTGQRVPEGAALFEVLDTRRLWVRVPVYVGALREVEPGRPVRLGELSGRPAPQLREATPVAAPPSANADAATVDLHYTVDNADGSLTPGQKVAVTMQLIDQAEHRVIPWRAVLHDIHGSTWIYAQTDTHSYERRRVEVVRVVGADAVMGRGPEVGVKIVTDGAAELFGTEFGIGK